MAKVSDLKDQIGTIGPRPLLYCEICGAEYSANAGDYWNCPSDLELTCDGNGSHSDEPLLLVIKRTVYESVAA